MSALLDWLHAVFVEQFNFWIVLGFIAQAMFMMRFVIQWIASERVGRSIVPVAFWFFSIAGGVLLLIYSIQRQDPVFIAGQALGLLIYFRNVWLIVKEKRRDPVS
ncbi:lipid-A-disaccharide synthase N-terminal domain-containing protein [Polymorphum gilvum]|uniref:Lipid A biosynthesis-like protein n=1 Tax=Polymorphum gilvum (strain LMG 25793 / CGMCC 1.9160 / SL003B-26A1) TaxID=991905 RepID=F2IXB0_POLGS|nr:lipid-A-disaccharide synthase N-terminal domain-containing protein [Polymorphum gilvum]ADZ70428.1 Lipid A biosynthesis-like protein [Polymorphum gilvum SL003B-26A1]